LIGSDDFIFQDDSVTCQGGCSVTEISMPLNQEDSAALHRAVNLLEHPSLAARLAKMAGAPIELINSSLPVGASRTISTAITKGLEAALKLALLTIRGKPLKRTKTLHKSLAVATGAAGGAFGLAALPVELPVSTIIMLRAIADIARSEGEDLNDPESSLACIQVFALGGTPATDDAAESGYFAIRGVLAKSLIEAARFIAERGVIEQGSPVLVRLIAKIGTRFGVVVTQKVAAQAIPVIGALGGAAVNYAFITHFQDLARGHFTVRRLEREYGKALVRREYQRVLQEMKEF
jgi:hypothetical protein